MTRKASPENRLAAAYKETFSSASAATVLMDMVTFAQEETQDPSVRAGRMDVIARILRQRGKDTIPSTAPTPYDQVTEDE